MLAGALFFAFFHTSPAFALEYNPMTTLPFSVTGADSIPKLINNLYLLLIGVSATYGVIKVAIAGVKYTISDVVTSKSEALSDIKSVLIGLMLLLIPVIVLETIYKPLTSLDIFRNMKSLGDTGGNFNNYPDVGYNPGLNCTDGSPPVRKNDGTWGCAQACVTPLRTCANSQPGFPILNSGTQLNANSATDQKLCTDEGGVVKRTGSPDGKFTCISKPNKPNTCNNSDNECKELCVLAGGSIGQDQGGYWKCN